MKRAKAKSTKKQASKKTKDDTWVLIVVLKEEMRNSFDQIRRSLRELAAAIGQIETETKRSQTFLEHTLNHQSEAIDRMQRWYEGRVTSAAQERLDNLCTLKTFTTNGVVFVRQDNSTKTKKGGN
jgi:hypothetical protein